MIRSELSQALTAGNPELNKADAEAAVGAFFDAIADHLAKGGRVELRGFGAFWTRSRDAREARNPRTGETVEVAARRALRFKAGKEIRDRLMREALR